MLVRFLVASCCIIFLCTSCGDFAKIQSGKDINAKLEYAIKFYDKKDYYKAGILLDQVVPLMKGKAEAEQAQFLQAYTNYYQAEYILSSFYFKEFYQTYPRSQYNEEAMFMYAKSLYKDSPAYNLDQTSTYDALTAIELFLRRYALSKFADEAKSIAGELDIKLEEKNYKNAILYFKIKDYKAGVVALKIFKKNFPASKYNEEVTYLIVASQYNLAKNSIEGDVQIKRYLGVIDYYRDFVDVYPDSKRKKAADILFNSSVEKIAEIAETVEYSGIHESYNKARNYFTDDQAEDKIGMYNVTLERCQAFLRKYPESKYEKHIVVLMHNCEVEILTLK